MTTQERQLIEKFRLLDQDAQQRVLSWIEREAANTTPFDYEAWLAQADAVRVTLPADSSGNVPSASDLVNAASEERDADILRYLSDTSGIM